MSILMDDDVHCNRVPIVPAPQPQNPIDFCTLIHLRDNDCYSSHHTTFRHWGEGEIAENAGEWKRITGEVTPTVYYHSTSVSCFDIYSSEKPLVLSRELSEKHFQELNTK